MKQLLLFLSVMVCSSNILFAQNAQKDTVQVLGYYESGNVVGTLNEAVDAARADGTINNTVFKLTPYEVYVLSRSIFMSIGQNLEIVAPKPLRAGDADPQTVQNSAPPQIVWTQETIDRQYIIQTYGNVVLKNIWVRYADLLGGQVSCSITFEDSSAVQGDDQESGYFEGVIFDYCPIGSEAGGAITVKADHFIGEFQDCYFRNLSDNHFQYYGRAISFPFQSTGFHYDSLLFENCTFTNLSRIVMMEGGEYGSDVRLNHCTLLNGVEWVIQTQGISETLSITNSIFVNPYMFGHRAVDVCDDNQDFDDYENGLCDSPGGGLINGITAVDSLAIEVPFTDYDRKMYIGNNAYMYQDWYLAWYRDCTWCQDLIRTRRSEELRNPSPMLGAAEIAFIDSTDENGNKVFTTLNVDWPTIFDADPVFMVPPINEDTLKLFIQGRWGTGLDIDWSYYPNSGFLQLWPLPENLAYTNADYMTAAMGNFPLGDLNWFPEQRAAWGAQKDAEWVSIDNFLNNGVTSVKQADGSLPAGYSLGQNYPNPFNPTTNIEYSISTSGHVSLKVFNNLGQEVATLFEGNRQAGKHVATFDGSGLASGVYLYRLESGNVSLAKKFVLMK